MHFLSRFLLTLGKWLAASMGALTVEPRWQSSGLYLDPALKLTKSQTKAASAWGTPPPPISLPSFQTGRTSPLLPRALLGAVLPTSCLFRTCDTHDMPLPRVTGVCPHFWWWLGLGTVAPGLPRLRLSFLPKHLQDLSLHKSLREGAVPS